MFFWFKNFFIGYKIYFISFIIFSIISNIQIRTLENKFNNLYNDISDILIIGTVISDKENTTYKSSYTIKVESINSNNKFNGTNLIVYAPKKQVLEYGDKVKIYGKYEKANTARNYKEFDYREYLKSKNIFGIVNTEKIEIIKKNNLSFAKTLMHNLRTKIKSNLKEILGEKSYLTIRYTASEIHPIFQMKLYKILKIVAFIIF